jgi:hypothetical protein
MFPFLVDDNNELADSALPILTCNEFLVTANSVSPIRKMRVRVAGAYQLF